MNSIEYIRKFKSKINLNILIQLLEEDGYEVTNEIITYLKTTPWNTNVNVFAGLVSGSGGSSANALQNEQGVDLATETGEVIEVGE